MDRTAWNSRFAGTLLTWLGGIAAGLLALPLAVAGCVAISIAGAGADPSHTMFECTEPECVSEWLGFAAVCGSALAVITTMLALVIRASRRSLQVAAILGLSVAAGLVGVALWAALTGAWPEPFLVVAAAAWCLGLGSWLRVRNLPLP